MPSVMHEDDAAALRLELNWYWPQILQRASNRFVPFARRIEHEETATAGAEEFAAFCASSNPCSVPCVDLVVADVDGEFTFECPSFTEDLPEICQVVFLQLCFEIPCELHHALQH